MARLMQGMAFGARPGGRNLSLFHAFQYVAPRPSVLPTIPVVYDLSFLRHPAWHPVSRLLALLPLADQCRRAPVVHTISAFSAAEIQSLLGVDSRRIHIIPPGVGEAFLTEGPLQPSSLAAFDLRADGFFLTVGTLEPRKNLRTLIQAYARLPESLRRRWPLCVAGPEGWGDMALPPEAAGLVEGGMLRFLGYLAVDVLRDLYCAARVVLYPSLYEGFGIPVIEAMACGAPVVCSNAAAIPEAGGALATYISPLDVDAWTQALVQVTDASVSMDPAQREQRRAHALGFRWSLGAERAVGLYQAALAALR
ncbi:glycosyltransferase family 1 protein [Cyanobium gracile UHCC 0139]|uniref:Glycosyltransferase family 1 protein n=1 Tax=Cyanobium gracile UHCC 0139 TaxID=3110308 RepID=A0ABU5RRT1_9CYAN|nr:glycosyltransferase family 1 protein [Cyanobium gracile]MEA5390458.1 glycosyltransferase family 1 protein [Cyanobium gracile UHCC 0139]